MSQKEKSSINLIGLPPDVAAAQRRKTADQLNTVDRGVAGSKLVEAIPHFNKSDSEKIKLNIINNEVYKIIKILMCLFYCLFEAIYNSY